MRYVMIIMLFGLSATDISAQGDTARASDFCNRFILYFAATSNFPTSGGDEFAQGATHVDIDVEYTRYFRVEGVGRFGIGARHARPWVEKYPYFKSVRVQEEWLEVPLYYSLGRTTKKNPSKDIIVTTDVGVFLGALLSQNIHIRPDTQMPVDLASNAGFLGYFKGGISLNWSISLPHYEWVAFLVGFSVRNDVVTFGHRASATMSTRNITIGIHFGRSF